MPLHGLKLRPRAAYPAVHVISDSPPPQAPPEASCARVGQQHAIRAAGFTAPATTLSQGAASPPWSLRGSCIPNNETKWCYASHKHHPCEDPSWPAAIQMGVTSNVTTPWSLTSACVANNEIRGGAVHGKVADSRWVKGEPSKPNPRAAPCHYADVTTACSHTGAVFAWVSEMLAFCCAAVAG